MILTITNGSYGKNTHAYFLLARIFYSATALFGRSNMKQSKFGILEQILIRSVGVRAYQSSVLLEREKGEKSSLIIEKAPLILTFSPEGRRDKILSPKRRRIKIPSPKRRRIKIPSPKRRRIKIPSPSGRGLG